MKAYQEGRHGEYIAYQREYKNNNRPVLQAKQRERLKDPVEAEKNRQRAGEWYAKNTKRARKTQAEHYKADPQASIDGRHKRRATMKGNTYEPVNVADIYLRDEGMCHLCGKHVTRSLVSLDHVVPVSKGGPHTAKNVKIAHLRCNLRRGVKPLPAKGFMFSD